MLSTTSNFQSLCSSFGYNIIYSCSDCSSSFGYNSISSCCSDFIRSNGYNSISSSCSDCSSGSGYNDLSSSRSNLSSCFFVILMLLSLKFSHITTQDNECGRCGRTHEKQLDT